jgi:putative drug exporter of the RND superfamily
VTRVLYQLSQFCVRRKFVVVGVWFVVAVVLVAVSHGLGDNTNDNLSLPGTNSQRATDTLAKSFPAQANGASPIVLHAPAGS